MVHIVSHHCGQRLHICQHISYCWSHSEWTSHVDTSTDARRLCQVWTLSGYHQPWASYTSFVGTKRVKLQDNSLINALLSATMFLATQSAAASKATTQICSLKIRYLYYSNANGYWTLLPPHCTPRSAKARLLALMGSATHIYQSSAQYFRTLRGIPRDQSLVSFSTC